MKPVTALQRFAVSEAEEPSHSLGLDRSLNVEGPRHGRVPEDPAQQKGRLAAERRRPRDVVRKNLGGT